MPENLKMRDINIANGDDYYIRSEEGLFPAEIVL
jgi:hypothetical protein